jgi:hypothetical protein
MNATRLTIFGVLAGDLQDDVNTRGLGHPVFGPLFDAGSYATLADVPPGPDALASIRDAALALPGVAWCDASPSLTSDGPAPWDDVLKRGGAISVVVVDGRRRHAAIVIFVAYRIPCMGAMPPCMLVDAVATWNRLSGDVATSGRYLLDETADELQFAHEAEITARLRQLYGE